jgi:hypothetical protein
MPETLGQVGESLSPNTGNAPGAGDVTQEGGKLHPMLHRKVRWGWMKEDSKGEGSRYVYGKITSERTKEGWVDVGFKQSKPNPHDHASKRMPTEITFGGLNQMAEKKQEEIRGSAKRFESDVRESMLSRGIQLEPVRGAGGVSVQHDPSTGQSVVSVPDEGEGSEDTSILAVVWAGSKPWVIADLADTGVTDYLFIPLDMTTEPTYLDAMPAPTDILWKTGYTIQISVTPGPVWRIPIV